MRDKTQCTYFEEQFCLFYVQLGDEFGNASAAYRRAYNAKNMKPNTVYNRVRDVLARPRVKERIASLRALAVKEAEMDAVDVFRYWVDLVTTDVNEIVDHRRTCCRFCHGKNHQRQWVEQEFASVAAKAIASNKQAPDPAGGFGFDPHRDPHPCCPVCFGKGVESVFIADTRKLSPKAKKLYNGLKQTRAGVEIKLLDRNDALKNIAKYLGMFKNSDEGGNNRPSTSNTAPTALPVDSVEASRIYAQLISEDYR